jgi:outer membrane protein assembly factor BamB
VTRGTVFAATENGTVAALDARSGDPRWTAQTNGSIESGVAVVSGLELAIVGDETGRLYAFGAANGTLRWVRPLDGEVAAAPAVAGRTLYVATRNGTVYGVTTLVGTVRWQAALGAPVILPPVVADGALYVADASGTLHLLRGTRHTDERREEQCALMEARYDSARCRSE